MAISLSSVGVRRTLQTDPIGSKDDLDLYAYVKGDPVNATDPTGLETTISVELQGEITPGVGIRGSFGWVFQTPISFPMAPRKRQNRELPVVGTGL